MKEELFKTRNTAFVRFLFQCVFFPNLTTRHRLTVRQTDEVLPGNTPMVDTLMAQSQEIPADINVEALVKDVGAVTFVGKVARNMASPSQCHEMSVDLLLQLEQIR